MDQRIERLKTSKDAQAFAANAKRLGESDLEAQAIVRSRQLQAIEEGFLSPAERAIGEALIVFEEEMSKIKGRKYHASRTRKMLMERTPLLAAERMVMTRKASDGYVVLNATGNQSLSFEAIVDRFPEEFSPEAVDAARARLAGIPYKPLVSDRRRASKPIGKAPARADALAAGFIEGFLEAPPSIFLSHWLPGYEITVAAVKDARAKGTPEALFDLIWKTQDNSVANVGQGILSFESVERLRPRLEEVIREIATNPSAETFDGIIAKFESWRDAGEINKVPRVLIARAFATLQPERYHTTVDAAKHERVVEWFAQHTGFATRAEANWAEKAEALVKHLSALDSFNDNPLLRNMFPWFVFDQTRRLGERSVGVPMHFDKPFATRFEMTARTVTMRLRHNELSRALYEELATLHGADAVSVEEPTGAGTYADCVVRLADGTCLLYEIKVTKTAAQAIREALGQLLEYAYSARGFEPRKLYVVAEPELDGECAAYLRRLNDEFNLKVEYLRLQVPILE
jgi:hypothetical protein